MQFAIESAILTKVVGIVDFFENRREEVQLSDIIEQIELRPELKKEISEFRKQYPVEDRERIPNEKCFRLYKRIYSAIINRI